MEARRRWGAGDHAVEQHELGEAATLRIEVPAAPGEGDRLNEACLDCHLFVEPIVVRSLMRTEAGVTK